MFAYILIYFLSFSTSYFDSIPVRFQIKIVSINDADIRSLGNWPIDRKWFGSFIEKAIDNDYNKIILNFAFPNSDYLHPESDSYLLSFLEKKNVFSINYLDSLTADSLTILNRKKIHVNQSIPMLSAFIKSHKQMIYLNTEILTHLDLKISEKTLIFDHKDILATAAELEKESLIDFLQSDTKQTVSNIIVLSSDIRGLTSYFIVEDRQLTDIEIILACIRLFENSHYYVAAGSIFILGLFLPLVVYFFKISQKSKFMIAEFFYLLLYAYCYIFNFYFDSLYLFFAFIPLLYFVLITKMQSFKREQTQISNQTQVSKDHEFNNESIQSGKDSIELNDAIYTSFPFLVESNLVFHPESVMRSIISSISHYAKSDLNIIIMGESGSGKELIAKLIHEKSNRSGGPFIAVNCGAIPENLIESELFGFEAGAFTGATKSKAGKFELADGGSIFLDEIAETNTHFQVKLLRFIQEGVIEKLGSIKSQKLDVRIISATHQNLDERIHKKLFREDLYYRLSGYIVKIPSLKERKLDIASLLFFMAEKEKLEIRLKKDELIKIIHAEWRGNVREFLMAVKRAFHQISISKRVDLFFDDFSMNPKTENVDFNDNFTDLEKISQPTNEVKSKNSIIDKEIDLMFVILSILNENNFSHRSITAIAERLNIHRSTATEYFKALVLNIFIKHNYDLDKVIHELVGENNQVDRDQLTIRIQQYLDNIRSRISEGVNQGLSKEDIFKKKFKAFPKEFKEDVFCYMELYS